MLADVLRAEVTRRDPMLCIYPVYCICVCLAMVGVITELSGLWGASIAAFCLVGVCTCYMKQREWKILKIENTEKA